MIVPPFAEPLARIAFVLSTLALQHPPCPSGSTSDPTRATAIRATLATTPIGARLSRAGNRPSICFTSGEGGIADDGTAFLPRDATLAQQASRFAHLWQHAVDGEPKSSPGRDQSCTSFREETARAEARADATEANVAAELSTTPLPHLDRAALFASRCAY
jgi:hypothetical protein